jgi:taurine--2-oxoglutarate transaminase
MEKLSREMLYAGLTYNSHPLACATASAVLQVYHEEDLVENARRQGVSVQARLEEIRARHPCVGDARGMGLFFCLELVNDRESKEPLDPPLAGSIRQRLLERGLSTNVMRNLLFIGPPLIVTESQLAAGLDIIDELLGNIDQQIR